jgi:hypothetical protein
MSHNLYRYVAALKHNDLHAITAEWKCSEVVAQCSNK